MPRHSDSRRLRQPAAGYTLIELMVTLVISMLVLIAGLSFYLMSRNSYTTIDDNANLEERGQFAISVMSRVLRQASYVPPGPSGGAMVITDQMIAGRDSCSTPGDGEDLVCSGGASVNGSDMVMVRYYGSGIPGAPRTPDESIVDCSGQAVAGYTEGDVTLAASQRGLSVFFVANNAAGKPTLMCKYRQRTAGEESLTTYVTQELVTGVENMQLLYGISTNSDDVPDKYVRAEDMTELEWFHIMAIKLSIVVRADNASADAAGTGAIQMFGSLYNGADGTFTPTQDTQAARRLFTTTLQVRNYNFCVPGDTSCL
ncbi:PilW family protein [Cupriavidus campinensis]|uniref:PilW family protein n=1 Tax=Cupriavidus campinensis TaxID=151783 RepID=UPI0011ECB8F1|nr:PilW family protein [Cupriavidus campinensis]